MKTIRILSVTTLVLFCCGMAKAQADTATVTFLLKATGDSMRGATACLVVNGTHRFCRAASQDGHYTFRVPDSLKPSSLRLEATNNGFHNMQWNSSIRFLGSRHIDLALTQSNSLQVAQWPLLEFTSSADPMQVDIDNGDNIGYTYYNSTVEPNKVHHISWKKDNRVICDTSLRLGPGQRLKLSCQSSGVIKNN